MNTHTDHISTQHSGAPSHASIEELVSFQGPASEFFPSLLRVLRDAVSGPTRAAVVVLAEEQFKMIACYPSVKAPNKAALRGYLMLVA